MPAVLLLIVIRLPTVPVKLKLVTVVIVLEGKVTVAGWTVLVMFVKVLAPVMVNAPAPPWFKVQL